MAEMQFPNTAETTLKISSYLIVYFRELIFHPESQTGQSEYYY